MTVKRLDNVGIVVEDIDAAIEFFTELGLELEGRAGTLARTLGRTEEGFALIRRALEQDPLSAHAYSNLGSAFENVSWLEESEAAFRKALELAPQKAGVRAALAVTLLERGWRE